MKKIILWIVALLLLVLISSGLFFYKNLYNRHPGYLLKISLKDNYPGTLKAGFAAIPITPSVPDRWTDRNHDGQYNPKDGDTYEDLNNNGIFDAVWMAGFQNRRPANGIHDNLWARTMVLDNGNKRIAIVSVDIIGFMHDDVIDVRNKIPKDLHITYSIICSTHTHEGPDMLGLWGKTYLKSGVNRDYMNFVKSKIVESIVSATMSLQPASLIFSQDLNDADSLVVDSRRPIVKDPGIRVLRAIDPQDHHTLGTLVTWACHPEILWSHNLLITSDFVNYVRQGIENGIYAGDSLVESGTGGVAVYINGCIGGLMTMDPETAVYDPWLHKDFKEPSFDKARSLGYRIASIALHSETRDADTINTASMALVARTLSLPFNNKLYRLGAALGVIDRGINGWWTVQSEVAALRIGPATFLTMPGEMYPEIVNGGIVNPTGADYSISPIEVPPIRSLISSKYKFVFGLSNDEIGYIIPQSEWDVKPPYLYSAKESPYGEINSLGPQTGPLVYTALADVIRQLQQP